MAWGTPLHILQGLLQVQEAAALRRAGKSVRQSLPKLPPQRPVFRKLPGKKLRIASA